MHSHARKIAKYYWGLYVWSMKHRENDVCTEWSRSDSANELSNKLLYL